MQSHPIPGAARINAQSSTIRLNYPNDRPILDTLRLEALVPAQPQSTSEVLATDYLEWAAKAFPSDLEDITI